MNFTRCRQLATACFLIAFSFSTSYAEENAVPDVTDAQIDHYKLKLNQDCRDEGHENGDTEADIEEYCGCMSKVLTEKVSREEWRRAVLLARSGKKDEEDKVTEPYVQAVQDACSGRLAARPYRPLIAGNAATHGRGRFSPIPGR